MMKWLVFCAISLPSILLRRETNSLFLPFFVQMCTLVARISSQPLQSALPILLSTQPSCNTYCVRFLLLLSLQCNHGCNFFSFLYRCIPFELLFGCSSPLQDPQSMLCWVLALRR
jgi:hypothetical protein